VIPSLPFAPMKVPVLGHCTVLPSPTAAFQSGLMALRCLVKTAVVPLPSERWTTVMDWSGNLAPGFAAAILGSFHLVILPWKISEYTSLGSLSSGTSARL